MSQCFKITYRTDTEDLYVLTINNAFNYNNNLPADVTRVNTAARAILNANAINTGCGNLSSLEAIEFCMDDVIEYDVSNR